MLFLPNIVGRWQPSQVSETSQYSRPVAQPSGCDARKYHLLRDFYLIETLVLCLLVALCVARFWLMPLPASFWVDESVTAFVVANPHDPSFAIAPQVPLSIYYLFPQISTALLGTSEIAFRLPSLLMMLIALWVMARLAARLIHPDAAWFVVLACFSMRGLNFEAIDARPYALGILVASSSLLLLVRWFDNGRWIDALWFVIAAALLWRVHLIFWPFYLIYGIYAATRLIRRETPVRLGQLLAVFSALVLLLLPVAMEAIGFLRQASGHVIADLPTRRDLKHAVEFSFVALCPVAAWLIWRLTGRKTERLQWSASSLALCLCWWLVVPIAIFAFSWISGNSVFVPRYYSEAAPGVAFAAAALSALFLPKRWWRPVAIAFGLGVLILVGDWRDPFPTHSPSHWREASQAIAAAGAQAGTPVICPSPFVEAQLPVWHPDYPIPNFLSCHLLRYSFPGNKYLFPYASSAGAEKFAGELAESKLAPNQRFFIYGGDRNVHYWRDWFAQQPELAGWSYRSLGNFGDVDAILFEAPRPGSLASLAPSSSFSR
jgi:Dolichyl-phosphate-mannose-protein mannosyltransferase